MNEYPQISDKQLKAVETFKNRYNCSQSVLSVFAEELNLKKDTALKLASPFGSGIAYLQETCGAVTGALMVIGLKYGKGESGTDDDKTNAYKLSGQFLNEFKKRNGTVCCRELLDGLNMSTPEGIAKIMELDLFRLRCLNYIRDAVEITENILGESESR
jgi:C_GCAxxG_C_C family probable redox protein